MKKGKQQNLLDLFVKKVKKKNLPKRDAKRFSVEREVKKKLAEQTAKYQQEVKSIKAPLRKALLEKMGLSVGEIEKVVKKSKEVTKQFRKKSKESSEIYIFGEPEYYMPPFPGADFGQQVTPPDLLSGLCEEIAIKVCKEKVCIDQPVPIFLENIFPEGDGSDSFQRSGNTFSLLDSVDSQSGYMQHAGEIEIWSTAELVESAKVRQIGMQLDHLLQPNGQPKNNGGCASGGKDCMILDWLCDVGWGKAKMTWKFDLYAKKPGENYEEVICTNRITYVNTGEIDSRISCWVDNVLGDPGHKKLYYNFSGSAQFPAGTQFLNKVCLNYEIEAGGDGAQGSASAYYNLKVTPFMNIETCSWELPETVTIHVPDWITPDEGS